MTDSLFQFISTTATTNLHWASLEDTDFRPILHPKVCSVRDLHIVDAMRKVATRHMSPLLQNKTLRACVLCEECHSVAMSADKALKRSRRERSIPIASISTEPVPAAAVDDGGHGFLQGLDNIRHESKSKTNNPYPRVDS